MGTPIIPPPPLLPYLLLLETYLPSQIYPSTSELSYFKVERQTYGLHLFRDICDDVVGKRLGCGTAYQQLPRSPYIQDTTASLETSLASPQGGSGGGVLLRPRLWRGLHRVSTRDWNLMLNSNSSLTGGQNHTHTILLLSTTTTTTSSYPHCLLIVN